MCHREICICLLISSFNFLSTHISRFPTLFLGITDSKCVSHQGLSSGLTQIVKGEKKEVDNGKYTDYNEYESNDVFHQISPTHKDKYLIMSECVVFIIMTTNHQ